MTSTIVTTVPQDSEGAKDWSTDTLKLLPDQYPG